MCSARTDSSACYNSYTKDPAGCLGGSMWAVRGTLPARGCAGGSRPCRLNRGQQAGYPVCLIALRLRRIIPSGFGTRLQRPCVAKAPFSKQLDQEAKCPFAFQ